MTAKMFKLKIIVLILYTFHKVVILSVIKERGVDFNRGRENIHNSSKIIITCILIIITLIL